MSVATVYENNLLFAKSADKQLSMAVNDFWLDENQNCPISALTIDCPNISAKTKIFADKCLISRHLTVIHENIPGLLGYFKTHASNNIDGWIVDNQN